MTIRPTRLLGDPILRARCDPVADPKSAAARIVADDLKETLRDLEARHRFGRALAAPQIGAPMRMIYVEIDEPWLLVNPEITDVGTEDVFVWDDCFSFPDLTVQVQRAHRIQVQYQDKAGESHTIEADGDLAELLQHEIDHLDGVLAVDRATGLDPFCLKEEWSKHYKKGGRISKPTRRFEPAAMVE